MRRQHGHLCGSPNANSEISTMPVQLGFKLYDWGRVKAGKINFCDLRQKAGLFYKSSNLNYSIFVVSENAQYFQPETE